VTGLGERGLGATQTLPAGGARHGLPATRPRRRRGLPRLAVRGTLLGGLGLILVLAAGPAGAQLGPHGLRPPPRTLEERLAAADAVAVGTVESVELGRIAVRDARAVRGAPGERFAVKRDPSRPPEVEPGDRVLWILRGAREPFLLVDEPRELLIFEDAAQARRLAAALRDLESAETRRELRALYVEWIEGGDERLREHGVRALTASSPAGAADGAEGPLLDAELARERARAALDPGLPEAARLASARVALGDPAGLEALLAGVGHPDVHPQAVQLALGVGALLGSRTGATSEGVTEAALAALSHPSPAVRAAGVRSAAALVAEPRVREALRRLAEEESDPEVRRQARAVLGRVERAPPAAEP